MNVFLRKKGLGLESIRSIMASMSHYVRIARVDIPRQPIPRALRGDLAFNWGTMASPEGYLIVNPPNAIVKTSDKGRFRKLLSDNGLSMHTVLSPYDHTLEEMARVSPNAKYVIRPANHRGGLNLRVASISELPFKWYPGGYASLYIPKVAEYRVFVAQNRVVYIAQKFVENPQDIAWNVEQGGRFENVRRGLWKPDLVNSALKAVKLGGLNFGAVDVIESSEGKFYVLEVNTAPALSGEYWIGCIAKTFDYMIDNGIDDFPDITDPSAGWRHYLHPALFNGELPPTIAPRDPEIIWKFEGISESAFKDIEAFKNKILQEGVSPNLYEVDESDTVKHFVHVNKTETPNNDILYTVAHDKTLELRWVEI